MPGLSTPRGYSAGEQILPAGKCAGPGSALGFLATTPPGCLAPAQTPRCLPLLEFRHQHFSLPGAADAAPAAPTAASQSPHVVMPPSYPSPPPQGRVYLK